jgi:hypothetical protein
VSEAGVDSGSEFGVMVVYGWSSSGLDRRGVAFPGMGLFWFGSSTDNVNWLRFWLSVLDCGPLVKGLVSLSVIEGWAGRSCKTQKERGEKKKKKIAGLSRW